jgi:hypothetical protein
VIRNAVIHLTGEQPVLADLFDLPKPGDSLLLCTNMRTLGGQRPVFIDQVASTFILPYLHVRFIELRPEGPDTTAGAAGGEVQSDAEPAEADLEIDEDFLRRIREA